MSNIIPFESAKLPAHIQAANVAEINSDLTAHAGGGFPVISIKGKIFAIVRDGEREVLMNPKDPDSAATSIEVVLVKANKGTSKVYYMNGYNPQQSEGAKPDCYSPDGTKPAADSGSPQSQTCALCPHNQWGSKINEQGVATKGKSCQDSVRMAVVPSGVLNDPMLLRVPPASIRGLGEYGQMLAKRGVAYNMVVTKIGFDVESESPKLTFKPVGFLDDSAYETIKDTLSSEKVGYILGNDTVAYTPAEGGDTPAPAPAPAAAPKPAPAAKKVAPKPAPAPAPVAAAPEPEPVVVVDSDPEIDLDGISFDDE